MLFEVIQKLKSDPVLIQKTKGLAIAGLVGFVLIGGVTLWASVAAVKHLASSANQVFASPITQERLQTVKSEFQLNLRSP